MAVESGAVSEFGKRARILVELQRPSVRADAAEVSLGSPHWQRRSQTTATVHLIRMRQGFLFGLSLARDAGKRGSHHHIAILPRGRTQFLDQARATGSGSLMKPEFAGRFGFITDMQLIDVAHLSHAVDLQSPFSGVIEVP